MTVWKQVLRATAVALGVCLASSGGAQQRANAPSKAAAKYTKQAAAPDYQPGFDQHALDVIKAACDRLAAAKSMAFAAIVSYESPSRIGPPLIYSAKSEVLMQRPDKLRVITLGDGPRSEFYYDGKTMTAYSPAENLVAVAGAPPTIDGALKKAYDVGAIYFPFTDVLVADPYKDIADGLKIAFYIGQSTLVDDTTTDMVAYVTGDVFVQAWIGTEDKLPRRIYAVYLNDPARLRHVLALTHWELDPALPANAFVPSDTSGAAPIAFERPDAANASGLKPPPKKTKAANPQ
ncbi:DUF2092 domain-containing protein [Paraburkholderia sp. LEh10]|uniref:DUF2092 domain-containing protein n=1 Tax=Paraburkholderia sp. LEh10 TaxID=2821353 RepID=UPI001AEB4D34|nr:DUF2092 domain-containing protein [Paraburkholderia sp. LEh10]MBP0595753.1 DUF2092 domain-containing protein [Paraburkholderia sp. LEh10]